MHNSPIQNQEILTQLESILADPGFSASPRLKEFFRFIVEETVAGNAGQLKAYTIATTVFGRGADFDPLHDPVVRVETAKLRNRLLEYYVDTPNPGPIRIEVPKGGYIPTFSRMEIPPLPEADETPTAPSTVKTPDFFGKTQQLALISVAVLPLINLSEAPEAELFNEGLTNEITLVLTRFEELSVVSSYTTRQLTTKDESLASIAQSLGVRFILHGSVQMNNNMIRLYAELADAATGTNIWAERLDINIDRRDMFEIQEEIAQRLGSRIGDSFGAIRRKLSLDLGSRHDENLEFYETMLCYHNWMASFDRDLFMQAKEDLEQLIVSDPRNPVAIATLADLYASDYQLGYNTVPNALDKAQEFALRAIAMDGSSQTAYWALALNFFLRHNRHQFEKAIAQVVPLNPANSYMLSATGLLVGLAGNFDEGILLIQRSRELNPCSPGWGKIVEYFRHYMLGDFESALNDALLVNTPDCFWEPMLRAAAFGQLGKRDEAESALSRMFAIQPDFAFTPARYINTLAFGQEAFASLCIGLQRAGLDKTVLYAAHGID
ncbi:MAG: hypothetical protein IJD04_05370 [Desulfovibrionaceae bacterium]|nr:hypothetical protein [Desulfovibrionaceae bacterium]